MTRRLLLSYLGLTFLVLAGLGVPLGIIYGQGELARFGDSVERDAAVLARMADDGMRTGDATAFAALCADYARRTGSRVTVVDRRGIVLSDSDPAVPAGSALSTSPGIAAALRNQAAAGRTRDQASNGEVFFAAVPTPFSAGQTGALRITSPATEVKARIDRMWLTLVVVGVTALAAVALLGFGLARWVVRPVRTLERAADRLATGRQDEPPPAGLGPPELRRLASAFTQSSARLQRVLQAQRSFATDATDQLKTPLTALRLRLENLHSALDPRAHGNLDAAIGEVDRLAKVVQSLLTLVPADQAGATPEPVDLDEIVSERVKRWSALAGEHGVRVAVSGPQVGWVLAVPGALEQIIDNLLANALRVAPRDSTITMAKTTVVRPGRERGRLVELHVIDQGPGMTEDARQNAVGRSGRAQPGAKDGTGLGLTVVRQLARASGGDIMLRPARGGGLDATVHLEPAPVFQRPRPSSAARRDPVPPARPNRAGPPTSAPAPPPAPPAPPATPEKAPEPEQDDDDDGWVVVTPSRSNLRRVSRLKGEARAGQGRY